MITKFYIRQRAEPCLVLLFSEALEKAGPYVGPRGGLWADPKHTIHWEPKKHGTERLEAMLADLVPNDKVKGVAEELGKLSAKKIQETLDNVKEKIRVISGRGEPVPGTLVRWQRILQSVKPAAAKLTIPKKPKPKAKAKPKPEKKEKEQLSLMFSPPSTKSGEPTSEPVSLKETETSITEPKPAPEKQPKPGAEPSLQEVGEHVWGSRKDLSDIARDVREGRRTIKAEELSKMSYDDAAYLVTKQNLIPPHDLQTLKGIGHTPGAAHMALAVLSFIKTKPVDTAQMRQQYVEDVRFVLSSLRGAQTFDAVNSTIDEWRYKHRRATGWSSVKKVELGTEGHEAAVKEAERLTEKTGVKHAVMHSYREGRIIAKHTPKPFDSLGKRFTSMFGRGARKTLREAKREAREADNTENGWAYLQGRGVETTAELKKRREGRLKHLGETKRGFSEAALYQGLAGTVERKGHTVEVKDANPDRIAKTFNMVNIDYGQKGYMTQADREHHTKMFEGAMHDFSEILGVEPQILSLNGRLGIAFGARGRGNAKAHYEPNKKVINITKFSGGGSLSHEWGHALDNVMAELFRPTGTGRAAGIFMSDTPSNPSYPPKVQSAIGGVMQAIKKHPDPAAARTAHQKKVRELDSEVDRAIKMNNKLVSEHKELSRKPESQERLDGIVGEHEQRIKRYKDDIKKLKTAIAAKRGGKPTRPQEVDLYSLNHWVINNQSQIDRLKAGGLRTAKDTARLKQLVVDVDYARLDINRVKNTLAKYRNIDPTLSDYAMGGQLMGKYWGSDIELFARGFESWVQDELIAANRKSDYLTGGVKTTRSINTGHVLPNGKPVDVYPRGEERESVGRAMRGLIDVLKETGNIEKALLLMLPSGEPLVKAGPRVAPMLLWPIVPRHKIFFPLVKSGPFIGPKGGKWKDPQHKIPYIGPEEPVNLKEVGRLIDSMKDLIDNPNPTDVRSVMIDVMAVSRKSVVATRREILRAVLIFGKAKMPPASLKCVTQAVKLLTKAIKKPKKSSKAATGPKAMVIPLKKSGGPYIGPRGGKWADSKHTIPWKPEAIPGKGKEPEQWGKLPPGKTAKEHVRIASSFLRKHKAALPGVKADITKMAGEGAKVKARTKTLPSALGKLVRKPKYKTAAELQDGTGVRVVHKTIREVRETVAQLKTKYKVIDEDDYITNPMGSYRSHHLIVEGRGGLAMEVQVRTSNQNILADWTHNVYKPVTVEQAKHRANPEVLEYEKKMADFMWAVDNEKRPPPRPACTDVVSVAFGCL